MDRRKGLLNKRYRFFFWIFLISLFFMVLFLSRLYFIAYKYGAQKEVFLYIPLIAILLWFSLIFFLFQAWGNAEFMGFISRLYREIEEVMTGERRNIFFRKKDPWRIENLKIVITGKLEKIKELERLYIIKQNDFESFVEEGNPSRLKEISNELNEAIKNFY